VQATEIKIDWKRFDTFFDLWRAHRDDTQLLYVIGEEHHCYIGSIGSRAGKQGLGNRYQWQYVRGAQAIFGLDEPSGQVAYSGSLSSLSPILATHILAMEALVQNVFVLSHGRENALFQPEHLIEGYNAIHKGDLPKFLQARR